MFSSIVTKGPVKTWNNFNLSGRRQPYIERHISNHQLSKSGAVINTQGTVLENTESYFFHAAD